MNFHVICDDTPSPVQLGAHCRERAQGTGTLDEIRATMSAYATRTSYRRKLLQKATDRWQYTRVIAQCLQKWQTQKLRERADTCIFS